MTYTQAVSALFSLLGLLGTLVFFQVPFFAVVGFLFRKTYPATSRRSRIGVVISARNEQAVIGQLIDSIHANRYPADKLTVFVMAHNCTDATARTARDHGAVVYEYDHPAEARVGYAYRKLFSLISRDYGADDFDGFLIVNSDNLLAPDYLERMNEAFVYGGGRAVITSFRNVKNPRASRLSALCGMLFLASCRMEFRGRAVCGVSSRVVGTGYLFPAGLVREGWDHVALTEDWELTADLVSQGCPILYCDQAEFFDDQPTTIPIMLRQRLRWARGHLEVFWAKERRLITSIFQKGRRFSKYDTALQFLPLRCIAVAMVLLRVALLCLAPLFGESAGPALCQWAIAFLKGFAGSYLGLMCSGSLVLFLERRRLEKLPWHFVLPVLLLWPLFLALVIPLDVAALFVRDLEWKPIPHHSQPSSEVTACEASSSH